MQVPRGTYCFEVAVIGAGHAGCEAALAAARLGCKTAVITFSLEKIAAMPCNPSVGGLGKSQIVREIDALGGEMARAADASAIHFRLLGASKGAAVRARRVQCDFLRYHMHMTTALKNCQSLRIFEGEATELLLDREGVCGVRLRDGREIRAPHVVLTTGTFLRGLSHIGMESKPAGRLGDKPSYLLSQSLEKAGILLGRLKTGTPARLEACSIDVKNLQRQESDSRWLCFSHENRPSLLPRVVCLITRTCEKTHEIIRSSLDRSPLFTGVIKGRGPRYCPSIEDKVVRFPERSQHQVILEPTGVESGVVYPNGISTSLPKDVQEKMVRSIKGLEQAKFISYGYAIEYDFVRTTQLARTLECKKLPGLFLAGQVNGTSGYEEAAGQGLIAGINAARRCQKKEPIVVSRSEGYIGVMIDDLVNNDVTEPYRMFTSRAEFRLLLREDNAWSRLAALAEKIGLLEKTAAEARNRQEEQMQKAMKILRTTLGPAEKDGRRPTLENLLRRPETSAEDIKQWLCGDLSQEVLERLEIEVKYKGYIEKQLAEVKKLKELERQKLPKTIEFEKIPGLSAEIRAKLSQFRPPDLGAASRIEGMTPAALMVLSVWLARKSVPRGTDGEKQ